jgi:hypothetical protein
MGELLRRGYDAQLADRNTKGYDLLVGRPGDGRDMRRVQVKTVRAGPWYVRAADYTELPDQVLPSSSGGRSRPQYLQTTKMVSCV